MPLFLCFNNYYVLRFDFNRFQFRSTHNFFFVTLCLQKMTWEHLERGSSPIDWCEGNYQVSANIAEFVNTVSTNMVVHIAKRKRKPSVLSDAF